MSRTDNYQFDSLERKRGDENEVEDESPLKVQMHYEGGDVLSAKEIEANALPPGGVSIVSGGTVVGGSIGSKEVRTKGFRAWFAKQRVKWCIAILVALILLSVVLVATLLAFGDSYDTYDSVPRLMKLWPRPNKDRHFIAFRHGPLETEDGRDWGELTTQLDELVAGYDKYVAKDDNVTDANSTRVVMSENRSVTDCFGATPKEGYSCFFDAQSISRECRSEKKYGYELGSPCVFIQFNNIQGWKPKEYNSRDLEKMDDLPKDLRAKYKPNVVYLDCQGVTLIDRENLGPVEYSPERGFKFNFFPYTGNEYYMPPLVAVHFKNPNHGMAISVECKLYAKNIDHNEPSVPSGRIYFSLLID